MKSDAKTPRDYLERLPDDRKRIVAALRDTILNNLPAGFEEVINYGMLDYLIWNPWY